MTAGPRLRASNPEKVSESNSAGSGLVAAGVLGLFWENVVTADETKIKAKRKRPRTRLTMNKPSRLKIFGKLKGTPERRPLLFYFFTSGVFFSSATGAGFFTSGILNLASSMTGLIS